MTRISPARASARAHMLLEAAEHLRQDVGENQIEREEAEKLATRFEQEAVRWFSRGLKSSDEYDVACAREVRDLKAHKAVKGQS